MLRVQVRALSMRIAMRQGRRVPFDDESAAIYDVVAPTHDAAHFDALLHHWPRCCQAAAPCPRATRRSAPAS